MTLNLGFAGGRVSADCIDVQSGEAIVCITPVKQSVVDRDIPVG